MKSIKYFKYKDTCGFLGFVGSYDYKLEDVKGFSFDEQKQCGGNILKWYKIHFKDDESAYFKVVIFKNLNEYHQVKLGFRGGKLFNWFEDADVRKIKAHK